MSSQSMFSKTNKITELPRALGDWKRSFKAHDQIIIIFFLLKSALLSHQNKLNKELLLNLKK